MRTSIFVALVAVYVMTGVQGEPRVQEWNVAQPKQISFKQIEQSGVTEPQLVQSLDQSLVSGTEKDILRATVNLGLFYWYQGNYPKAISLYNQALDLTKNGAGDSGAVAICLNNLGILYRESGQYASALRAHAEALSLAKSAKPTDQKLIADSYFGIGLVVLSNNDYEKAESNFKSAEEGFIAAGDSEGSLARLNDAFTRLYLTTGRLRLAQIRNEQCWKLLPRLFSADDAEMAEFLDTRATLEYNLQKFTDAEKSWTQARTILQEKHTHDPHLIPILLHLGELHMLFNEPAQAEPLFTRCLSMVRNMEGPHSAEGAILQGELGMLYTRMRDYPRAEENFRAAMQVLDTPVPARPLELSLALTYFGDYYRVQSKWSEAYEYFKRAADLRQRVLGDHELVVVTFQQCAEICKKLKRKDEAREYLEKAQAMAERCPQTQAAIASTVDVKTLRTKQ